MREVAAAPASGLSSLQLYAARSPRLFAAHCNKHRCRQSSRQDARNRIQRVEQMDGLTSGNTDHGPGADPLRDAPAAVQP
jgi:hypothetical protein